MNLILILVVYIDIKMSTKSKSNNEIDRSSSKDVSNKDRVLELKKLYKTGKLNYDSKKIAVELAKSLNIKDSKK